METRRLEVCGDRWRCCGRQRVADQVEELGVGTLGVGSVGPEAVFKLLTAQRARSLRSGPSEIT